MPEYKHGELESGAGKKVENPRQAVAIAMREAGASKYEAPQKNAENLRKTKAKECSVKTAKARKEGG